MWEHRGDSKQLCAEPQRRAFPAEGTSELTLEGRFTEHRVETVSSDTGKSTCQAQSQNKVVGSHNAR